MQGAEIFPFQAGSVPYRYWSSDPRGCNVSATDRFPLYPRSE